MKLPFFGAPSLKGTYETVHAALQKEQSTAAKQLSELKELSDNVVAAVKGVQELQSHAKAALHVQTLLAHPQLSVSSNHSSVSTPTHKPQSISELLADVRNAEKTITELLVADKKAREALGISLSTFVESISEAKLTTAQLLEMLRTHDETHTITERNVRHTMLVHARPAGDSAAGQYAGILHDAHTLYAYFSELQKLAKEAVVSNEITIAIEEVLKISYLTYGKPTLKLTPLFEAAEQEMTIERWQTGLLMEKHSELLTQNLFRIFEEILALLERIYGWSVSATSSGSEFNPKVTVEELYRTFAEKIVPRTEQTIAFQRKHRATIAIFEDQIGVILTRSHENLLPKLEKLKNAYRQGAIVQPDTAPERL